MLAIIGDIHSFFELLVEYSKIAKEAGCSAMIQVGDFGMSWMDIQKAKGSSLYPHIPVYVIAGNHEDFDQWQDFEGVKEVMHNVFFVQKGHIMKLDGLNVLFFGGASSIDKKWQGSSWDWREDIQPSDVVRFQKNYAQLDGNIDLMIAHVPPKGVIDRNFDPKQKLAFDVPIYWQDKSAPIVEEIWKQVGEPVLKCGHMHKRVIDGNCQILDINEMIFYPPAPLLSAEEANAQMSPEVRALQKERLDDLESVRKSRIIPPMNEPEPWEHPISYNHPLSK